MLFCQSEPLCCASRTGSEEIEWVRSGVGIWRSYRFLHAEERTSSGLQRPHMESMYARFDGLSVFADLALKLSLYLMRAPFCMWFHWLFA